MDIKFIAHNGYIFKNYFAIPFIIAVALLFFSTFPFSHNYHQKSVLTIVATVITLFTIIALAIIYFLVKNNTEFLLHSHGLLIKYPFSSKKQKVSLGWSDILRIESDILAKHLYIITQNQEVYALNQDLWNPSSPKPTNFNSSFIESDLYLAFKEKYSITETNTIDANTYKKNFEIFFGNHFLISMLPLFITYCLVFYNYNELHFLKTQNLTLSVSLLFLSSYWILAATFYIKCKSIRFINSILIKTAIYSLYFTALIICFIHEYSINTITPSPQIYTLQKNSDYQQIWVAETDLPNIVIQKYAYPDKRFLYEKEGTKQSFHIIHGMLDSYDVANADIEAVLSPITASSSP